MGNTTKKAFPVLNMHCAGCANNVERTVKKLLKNAEKFYLFFAKCDNM